MKRVARHFYAALAATLSLFGACGAVSADDPTGLINAVEAAGHPLPPPDTLRTSCNDDMLCVARFIRDRIGAGSYLIPVEGPSGERSGWSGGAPSLGAVATANGTTIVQVLRFDTQAIEKAAAAGGGALILDVRRTSSTDLDAMRRVAALFTGSVARAFTVKHMRGRTIDWTIQAPKGAKPLNVAAVWVGPETGSVAALFAALLQKHAGAELRGDPTPADAFLTIDIPVIHGWDLRVPTSKLEMPGIDLAVGLTPVGPVE